MQLTDCRLFEGIAPEKLEKFLFYIKATRRGYGNGQIVLHQGQLTDRLGIVLSGSIEALHYSRDGKISLINTFTTGKVFADFLAASSSQNSPVTLMATKQCSVMFISVKALFEPLPGYEIEGRRLLANLVGIYADEYFALKDRIYCLTAGTLREKIYRLLELQKEKTGKSTFSLPYGRDKMAALLNAERSALCRELSNMQRDGIIDYKGKVFSIRKEPKAVDKN